MQEKRREERDSNSEKYEDDIGNEFSNVGRVVESTPFKAGAKVSQFVCRIRWLEEKGYIELVFFFVWVVFEKRQASARGINVDGSGIGFFCGGFHCWVCFEQ